MINSYFEIKDKIENLHNNRTPNDFVTICNRALGGKRGLSRTQLIQAMASDSTERIHNLLEPVVNALLAENQKSAEAQEDEYNVLPLDENEYRLIKTKNKDKYGRGANDYIINAAENTCTCPEFTNRLRNLFLPCKHQYMVNVPITASTIDKKSFQRRSTIMFDREEVEQLLKVADSLDRKGHFKMADIVENIMTGVIEENPKLADTHKQVVQYLNEIAARTPNLYPGAFLTKKGIELFLEYYITEEAHSPEMKTRFLKWTEENIDDPNVRVGQFAGEYKCPSCIALKLSVTYDNLDDIKRATEKFLTYIPPLKEARDQILKEELPKLEGMEFEEIMTKNKPIEDLLQTFE